MFIGWTTSFQLASDIGAEIGESFAEKVDQRVAKSYASFKATVGNTLYSPTPTDGFARPSALGAMELRAVGATGGTVTAGFTASSVLELVRNVKLNWKNARLPGNPVIVLDQATQFRMLGELTGGAVSQSGGANLSDLGNELLSTGRIESLYGCSIYFTTFLSTASRSVAGGVAENVLVGAYYGDRAIYTVMKEGLIIKMGEQPGGLQQWITGLGYFGSGVGDGRRGGAINIEQVA